METARLVKPRWFSAPEYVYDRKATAERLEMFCYWAALAELPPLPEQRLVLEGVVAVDHQGRAASFECYCICCRQNMKTGAFKQAGLGWLISTRDNLIVWSAHRLDAVNEAVEDFDEMLAASAELKRNVRYFNRSGAGTGDAEIGTRRGTRMLFKVRSKGGGRALSGDKVILDEYWAVQPAHLGALVPIMAAKSMHGDPQIIGGSSAARPESGELRRVVKRGRAGKDPSLFYAEWCAPDPAEACDKGVRCDHDQGTAGCGCDKPDMVRQANPATGVLISMDHILTKERHAMPVGEYGRERMGWHDQGEDDAEVIPLLAWAARLDPSAEIISRPGIACVFSARRDRAAVAVAGWRDGGGVGVELADYRPGTGWTTQWLIDRFRKLDPVGVAIDGGGHEKSIIPDLEDAGVVVTKMTTTDVTTAYGMIFDGITDEDAEPVVHRGQDDLTLALAAATTRDVGDAGTAWGRKKTAQAGMDISPIVAVTEALWVFLLNAPPLEEDDEPGVWVL